MYVTGHDELQHVQDIHMSKMGVSTYGSLPSTVNNFRMSREEKLETRRAVSTSQGSVRK